MLCLREFYLLMRSLKSKLKESQWSRLAVQSSRAAELAQCHLPLKDSNENALARAIAL